MATLIRADGTKLQVTPRAAGGSFSAQELVALIQCPPGYLEAIHMPPGLMGPDQTDSMYMWMDEEGKFRNPPLRPNRTATSILRPIMRPDDPWVVGNVVITTLKEGGAFEDEEEQVEEQQQGDDTDGDETTL